MSTVNAAAIIESLEPLFEEAERKKLWFYCQSQGVWFSPKELRKAHAEGCFVWGPVNWTLSDPQVRLRQLICDEQEAARCVQHFRNRIAANL